MCSQPGLRNTLSPPLPTEDLSHWFSFVDVSPLLKIALSSGISLVFLFQVLTRNTQDTCSSLLHSPTFSYSVLSQWPLSLADCCLAPHTSISYLYAERKLLISWFLWSNFAHYPHHLLNPLPAFPFCCCIFIF